jgi:DNA polymerase-4
VVASREQLHAASLGLIRSVFPVAKGIRLVGVTLSNFTGQTPPPAGEFSLLAESG